MPNRLAAEKSPYLRQHADNPVDWLPWGAEALTKAAAEQKPIFLSIGYSTCHWCHVMAHECFENLAVAAILNRDFVPVKVDREERPDLDRVYMTYVQQTTGHGGWPMSVWLTPDGKPFFGGTYFPPEDRHGRPGFVTVLNAITQHWTEQRTKILQGADEVVAALQRYAAGGGSPDEASASTTPLPAAASAAFTRGFEYFYEAHDPVWGGFGGAPKFPRASVIDFLFRTAIRPGADAALRAEAVGMATHTLQKMAEGGLHDHVGGGFHRYAVDERWFVPHFEKMLYDQAQLARNYLEARQVTGREVFAWVARGIFDYVRRDLTAPGGAFYSAEDADSAPPAARSDKEQGTSRKKEQHAEGAFYVWTTGEIEAELSGSLVGGVPSPRGNAASPGDPAVAGRPTMDADFFCAHYGVKPEGNVAHDPQGEFSGKNILMQQRSLLVSARETGREVEAASQVLVQSLEKLRGARATRPRPHRDDKIITAWNGLMISALAKGAQVLGDAEYLAAATRAAEFIARELYVSSTGTLYRSWREGRSEIAGFAEDYAFLIQGLLDLYETGFAVRWLQWAVELQERMDAWFWDEAGGGYFSSRSDDPTVIVRLKEEYDGAEPAANSVAAQNLFRLDWMLGLPGAGDKARQTIAAHRSQWSRAPQALPQMLCAMEMMLTEPRSVVLAGDPTSADYQALAAVLHQAPGPRRVLLCADQGPGQAWLAAHRGYLADLRPVGGASAYLCENGTCRPPVMGPAEFRALLS